LLSTVYGTTNFDSGPLANFLSVSQTTARDAFFAWQRRDGFLPMITCGQRPVYMEDDAAMRTVLSPAFEPEQTLLLPPNEQRFVTVTNRSRARVVDSQVRVHSVSAEIIAEEPALVSLAQTYFHHWRAYVDGKPAHLLRANYAFQAVEVPAGRHAIRLVYEDGGFLVGALISGVAMVGCVVALVSGRKRNKA